MAAIGNTLDRVASIVTTVALLLGMSMVYKTRMGITGGLEGQEPLRIDSLTGRSVNLLAIDPDGREQPVPVVGGAHVVYLFLTTCHFCASQHAHIGEVLATLPPGTVITVSVEPKGVTEKYWNDVSRTLAPPLSISQRTISSLGVSGVPTLVFLNQQGRIASAYVGTSLPWGRQRFEAELASAAQKTFAP